MSNLDERIAALSPEQREKLLAKLGAQTAGATPAVPIPPRAAATPARLSFAQQRLWLSHQMDPAEGAYNIPVGLRVKGPLDASRLEQALAVVVQRHEVLRTRYAVVDGEARQFVEPSADVTVLRHDLEGTDASEREAAARRIAAALAVEPFDLLKAPMLRAAVIRCSDAETIFVLVVHHVACDGWSIGILLEELFAVYAGLAAGREAPLRPLPIQYADFAEWQRERLQGDVLAAQVAFWRGVLEDAPMLQLATDLPRTATRSSVGNMQSRVISSDVVERLDALVKRERATQTIVVLALFQALLARYTGQDDIVVGSTFANRNAAEIESLVGCFVNVLPLRADLSGNPSFSEVIARVREASLQAYDHQELPFEKLVEHLNPHREPGENPFFQVAMSMHNAPFADVAGLEMAIEPFEIPVLVSRFDVELHVIAIGGTLRLDICYAAGLFDATFVAGMLEAFERLLRAAAADPATSIASVDLTDDATGQRVVAQWNDTAADYPRGSGIPELVERHAVAEPGAVAIVLEDVTLTYAGLNDRANRLARYLRRHGVERGARVGICLERGIDMVVGVLAILKAGGAYVPLDPEYPDQRLAAMLDDSRPVVVVTEHRLNRPLSASAARTIHLDAERDAISAESSANLSLPLTGDDLAYVMYTSGSTGRPKGVCVPHRAVVRLVWRAGFAPLDAADVVAQVSNSSFDAATFEIWGTLINGARLAVIPRESLLVPAALSDAMRAHGVTAMFLTTALFNQVARERPSAFSRLRHVMFGGEAVDPRAVARVLENGPPARLLHVYGPTENTTFSTWFEATRVPDSAITVPIGRAVSNSTVYVLDDRMRAVAPGIPGEIFVGGEGLAFGYLDRSAMTAEKFVPSPFGSGERLYRTGDIGRWTSDGHIEFMGRNDDQVKIRGFRIEPGEIVAVLSQHEAVKEAAVLVDGKGAQKRLIAYVIFKESSLGDVKTVRGFLREKLPDHMVPGAFVEIDRLPLTPNGKIDRRALPDPADDLADAGAHVAPRTDLEQRIAAIWRDVMANPNIGIADNFFDVGGHSLLLVAVHARIEEDLGRKVPIVALFRYPTIEALAGYLAPAASVQPKAVERSRSAGAARSGSIAIVGLAGRFPGASDVEAFWANLRDGVESIRHFSDEEMRESGIAEALLSDPRYVKARGALDDVDKFDAPFFGYTPREAELMDPQHRLFLECAWHALENAGCDPHRHPGRIGVYAGAKANSYILNLLSDPRVLETAGALQAVIASQGDFLPTRVSYKLNLRGPSVNVQSACSTSLVAVHEACRSLMAGDCDMALAGGVTVVVPGKAGYLYQEDGIGSPDGHCRAFDARARGTVGGDGVAVVVLKRFEEAVEDGDVIHAVIRGSAINNDGSNKVGFTAPSVEGQAEVIKLAHEAAGVEPDTISYIEAHGTGTALGDPIEVSALAHAFGDGESRRSTCAIGSLKTNIGHLDAAAGVSGLIKTVLALEHREIPPSLHFESPNPAIDFAATRFAVSARLQPWSSADGVARRAGVSSFGIGGTNAHVIVEEAPARPPSGPSRPWKIITLSARTDAALEETTAQLRLQLKRDPPIDLADAAYTFQTGRAMFDRRRAIVCKAGADALQAIDGLRAAHRITAAVRGRPSVAFLFPGQGSQFDGMGRELYGQEPVFRKTFDGCADQFAAALGVDLKSVLFAPPTASAGPDGLRATSVTQAALFAVELSMARLWMSFGIIPTACIGHSIGEYVAACVSGVLTTADAVRLIARRGLFMDRAPQGAMLALPMAEADVRARLVDGLWLAVVNAPSQCVVAGTVDAIEDLAARLDRDGIRGQRLNTAGAFHSGLMDGVEGALEQVARDVTIGSPAIPYVSNFTGDWISAADLADRSYWAKHTRGTVRFSDGVRRLIESGANLLLEVGPGRVLSSLVRRQLAPPATVTIVASPVQHPDEPGSEAERFACAIGHLWTSGVDLDWSDYYAHERRLRIELSQYPFARERYWIERRKTTVVSVTSAARSSNVADWLYAPVWKQVPAVAARAGRADDQPERWLVFDDGGHGAQVASALTASGAQVQRYSDVSAASPSAHAAAIEDCSRHGGVPPHVVVVRDTTTALPGLANLVKALTGANVTQPIDIRVLSRTAFAVTGDEVCEPRQAALVGLCRVVPQEHPNLRCTLIDLAGDRVPDAAMDRLVSVLRSEPVSPVLAIRGSRQWALTFEPVGRGVQPPSSTVLKAQGVYLVTGGLGRIGLALAEHLVDTVGAAVVLVGRNDFLSERVNGLESRGRVMIARADVADERRMRQVVVDAEKAFGPLTGVFHAAGSTSGEGFGPIAELGPADFDAQFRSKADGALVLSRVLGPKALDFVALFSSISTVLGGLGFGAYAAANAFLDGFAEQQTRVGTTPWVSIGWDGWRFDGPRDDRRATGPGAFALAPEEGMAALDRALRFSANPIVVVSTADLLGRASMLAGAPEKPADAASEGPAPELHARPELGSIYVPPRTDREHVIASVWQELLGITPVGVQDNFFELGGHSLLAVQLVFRLSRDLQIDLSAHHVFEASTVAELAVLVDDLVEKRARQAAEIANVLDEVAGLSDEEVERLLAGD